MPTCLDGFLPYRQYATLPRWRGGTMVSCFYGRLAVFSGGFHLVCLLDPVVRTRVHLGDGPRHWELDPLLAPLSKLAICSNPGFLRNATLAEWRRAVLAEY